MSNDDGTDFTIEELEAQHTAELPGRELMVGISLLGIPLIGVSNVGANVDTSGPNWLFGL